MNRVKKEITKKLEKYGVNGKVIKIKTKTDYCNDILYYTVVTKEDICISIYHVVYDKTFKMLDTTFICNIYNSDLL